MIALPKVNPTGHFPTPVPDFESGDRQSSGVPFPGARALIRRRRKRSTEKLTRSSGKVPACVSWSGSTQI